MPFLENRSECWTHAANIKETASGTQPLSEKVLQFGTGVLLRGLPDYYIDKANKQGIFNGRIVGVKSTSKDQTTAFEAQNSRYTVAIRGFSNGAEVSENVVNTAISRVINANTHWEQVLEQAANPDLELIISNTTEAGIVWLAESIHQSPPTSFPAKLTAFLYERYGAMAGTEESGIVVIPTELIPNNGKILCAYVVKLARFNKLPLAFLEWLEKQVTFCNSLVDRIVPGLPASDEKSNIEKELGYTDDLMVMAEPYSLWAIEGDDKIKSVLSFAQCDSSIKIVPDISLHREIKLRLLNATHTLSCGFAVLSGISTVKDAMQQRLFSSFITDVMKQEIGKTIDARISEEEIADYIHTVIDRFKNPYIKHQWMSITMEYTAKVKMRCLPVLLEYYKRYQKTPVWMAKGFAAWLLFMKAVKVVDGDYFGICRGNEYKITDAEAKYFYELWNQQEPDELVETVLGNSSLWDTDLCLLPGFAKTVRAHLHNFINAKLDAAK